jgi:zinc protease
MRPKFDAALMGSTRQRQLAALHAALSDPFSECGLFFDEQLFTDSPYRFPPMGTEDSIGKLTVEDLRDFYNRVRVGRNMVVTVAGDVQPAEVERAVRKAFAGLKPGDPVEAPAGLKPLSVPATEVCVRQVDKPGATVIVGYPGTDLYNLRDRFAMDVFDTICSGYQMPRGWLHDTLRGQSLVYAVHFDGRLGLLPGYYRAVAVCQPDKATRVARLMEDLLYSGRHFNYTDDDLRRAVATILTTRQMNRQLPEQAALMITLDELYGLGYNFEETYDARLKTVTAEDVRAVVAKFINQPIICITTPQPDMVQADELRRPYDAARLKELRVAGPKQETEKPERADPQ